MFKKEFNSKKQLKKLLKILETIQYGKHEFPYLLTLQFAPDSYDLMSISLWDDPHYRKKGKTISVFKGDILVFPDLFQIKRNPTSFFKAVKSVRDRSKESNKKQWEQEVGELPIQSDWKGEEPLTIAEQESLRIRWSLLGNIERAKLLQPDCVCIGGTTDTVLAVGSPSKEYFIGRYPVKTFFRLPVR